MLPVLEFIDRALVAEIDDFDDVTNAVPVQSHLSSDDHFVAFTNFYLE